MADTITVGFVHGSKKKARNFSKYFNLGTFRSKVEEIFPSLIGQNWHAETLDGTWIEDSGDWEIAVQAYLQLGSLDINILDENTVAQPVHQQHSINQQLLSTNAGLVPVLHRSGNSLAPVKIPNSNDQQERIDLVWHQLVCIMREATEAMDVLYLRKQFPGNQKPPVRDLHYLLYRELQKGVVAVEEVESKKKWSLLSDPFHGAPLPANGVQKMDSSYEQKRLMNRPENHNIRMDRMRNELFDILRAAGEPMNVLFIRKKFSWPTNEKPLVKELNYLLYKGVEKGNIVVNKDSKKPTFALS